VSGPLDPNSHAALFALINKSRLLNGWQTRSAQELDPTIRTWHEAFSFYGIPVSAYNELYQRALEFRALRLATGHEPPQMDATLLISQWTGLNGLQAEITQRSKHRTLTANAESTCPYCYGSGFRESVRGDVKGVIRCNHAG
jgi:hypothetical protein